MARRSHARRPTPWRRTRAYRLTRTVVVTVALAVGGVWWTQADESAPAPAAAPVPAADGAEATASTRSGEGAGAGAAQRRRATAPPTGRAEPAAPTRPAKPARKQPEPSKPTAPPRPTKATEPAKGQLKPGQPGKPGRPGPGRPQAPPAHRNASATPRVPGAPATLPRSRPTTLTIPYLDIEAPVMDLRLDRRRQLPAPPDDDNNLAGWYAGGPSPGENGTVIVVGHRDTRSGPAVFAGLDEIEPGRLVELRRADGRIAVYTVDAVKTYDKAHFPSREVYGARARPELRLITCGGDYDRRTGYTGNIVVYAHLTATR
ncbi:class F sortase [Streptomyces sp. NPDC020898]|uniref:class F sortase n=1 Tax=Streptomyces sp. NPDC020898 TaxID=3365101 RepID=UPI0037BDF771